MSEPAPLFPLFLKLASRRVVVVGGGAMAASKVEGLLRARAVVIVLAPEIRAELARPDVQVRRRAFRPSDLDGAWLAIAAATPDVNRQVAAAAEERHIFVNAVDDPAAASAYMGGVIRKGGATVAISTEGQAPALAGLLRQGLESLLPHDLEVWTVQARALRELWKSQGVPIDRRRPLLLDALNRLYREAAP
ncbi:MAG TPA: bifunctional precorrin-2 dehydrogenase/sirohydrochlorin ferrochelatase [Myxococcaceae bacterium]|nr:bifunctional precorrin-2 dehydrogenase/sirohydrochlorin ferrochelatase [Myxococcaceae bacterium]